MTFEGAVQIDGKFTGDVRSNGMLIIGEKALVKAEIQAAVVLVRGEFYGTIRAKDRLEAYAPAKIHGEIHSPVLVFGEGVSFEGSSHMTTGADGEPKTKAPTQDS